MSTVASVKKVNVKAISDRSDISSYFEELITQYQAGNVPCLFLPSLTGLAKRLGCSMLDIQCVLLGLRKQGYDFFFLHADTPITFWYPAKISLSSEL